MGHPAKHGIDQILKIIAITSEIMLCSKPVFRTRYAVCPSNTCVSFIEVRYYPEKNLQNKCITSINNVRKNIQIEKTALLCISPTRTRHAVLSYYIIIFKRE